MRSSRSRWGAVLLAAALALLVGAARSRSASTGATTTPRASTVRQATRRADPGRAAGRQAVLDGGRAPTPEAPRRSGAPESFADLAERVSPGVVNIQTSKTVGGQPARGAAAPPARGVLRFGGAARASASQQHEQQGAEPRLRLRDLRRRLHRHQQPRRRGRRQDQGRSSTDGTKPTAKIVGRDPQDRHRADPRRDRRSRCPRCRSATPRRCGPATGSSRSATRSASSTP